MPNENTTEPLAAGYSTKCIAPATSTSTFEDLHPGRGPDARFKPHKTVREVLSDIAIAFLLLTVGTQVLKHVVPGHPIIVGSESIQRGLYWLNTSDKEYTRDKVISFTFNPLQHWTHEIYPDPRTFTKLVWGVEGDTVSVSEDGLVTLCAPEVAVVTASAIPGKPDPKADLAVDSQLCRLGGTLLKSTSKGKPLPSWAVVGKPYTLKNGELWIYGGHARSLDSRYFGPISRTLVKGVATPVMMWRE